jgi:transposase
MNDAPTTVSTATPRPGLPALQQIRDTVQALLAQGKTDDAWAFCLGALEAVLRKTSELELLVTSLRRAHSGRSSERVDPGQLALLFDLLGGPGMPGLEVDRETLATEDAALDRAIKAAEAAHPEAARRRRKARKVGAGWQTRGVDRQVHQIEVAAADRTCPTCQREMNRIGVDVTRRLEYVPGHFVEHEYHVEKVACGRCKDGVTTAPAPTQVLDRRAADPSLLAHIVVSKYADHTPLHRLSRIYARSGAEIPVSTLADWTSAVGDLVAPVVQCLAARVLAADIVRTDATGVKVLDPHHPAHVAIGSMWGYIGDDRDVVFRYTPTGEGATGPWAFLAGRTGYVQADASNVFDRLFTGEVAHAVEVGCWSHARRKLVVLEDTDARVAYPLTLIARLYRIEHLADALGVTPDGRVALREERSIPALERLQRWCVITQTNEPPSAALAKATAYLLNHWSALTRFVTDGRLDLDNNLTERQLRDIAIGRKNYLFAGSHAAARRAADLYSLMRTCAQYGVPPLAYFTDLLQKLGNGWTITHLEELLPHRWLLASDPSTSAR